MISFDEMQLDFRDHVDYAMMSSDNESSQRQSMSKRNLIPQARRHRRGKTSQKKEYNWCDDCDDIHPTALHSSTANSQHCPQLALGLEQKHVEAFALKLNQPVQPATSGFCLGDVRRWACGFCSKLWNTHNSYKAHIHEHLRNQQHRPKRWKHSLIVSGLLKQANIRNAWQAIIDKTMLFRRFQWDEASTGRAPYWMSTYGRAMQLQDYLERFNGSKEEGRDLAQLAFDLSRQAAWLRETSPSLLARARGKSYDAPLLEYYRVKPLPRLPRRPPRRTVGKKIQGHKRNSVVSQDKVSHEAISTQTNDGKMSSSQEKRQQNDRGCSSQATTSDTDSSRLSSGTSIESQSSSESQSSDEETALTSNGEGLLTNIGTNGAFAAVLGSIIETTMQEFWSRWNQSEQQDTEMTEAGSNSRGGQAYTNTCHDVGTGTVQSMGFSAGSFKRKRSTGDNSSEDEGGNQRQPPRKLPKPLVQDSLPAKKMKLACPFRKHDPVRYSLATHQVCAASGWTSIHRLKEHLNRCHRAIYCPRCRTTFKNKSARDAHLNVPSIDICQAREEVPIEGITDEQESQLRSRKKKSHEQTEEDRWASIYSLLFPLEAIPSPYFEPITDGGGLSPTSNGFQECEGYIRRQVPRLVQRQLIEMATQDLAPVEQRLMGNLQEIIQGCIETAFSQYREEQQHTTREGQATSSFQSIPSVESSMTEPSAPQTVVSPHQDLVYAANVADFDFLDSIYAVPPVLSEDAMQFLPTTLEVPPIQACVAPTDSGYTSGQVCDTTEASCDEGRGNSGSCFDSFPDDPFVGELDEMGKFYFWGQGNGHHDKL